MSYDHNTPTFDDHLAAIERATGLVVRFQWAMAGLYDNRLQRSHRLVLWALLTAMNNETGIAWPGRDWIRDRTNLAVKTISNALHELKLWGYIHAEVRVTPELGGRKLNHYTLPAASVSYEDLITQYVGSLRLASPPAGNTVPPREGTGFPAEGEQASPPAGNIVEGVPCGQGSAFPADGELAPNSSPPAGKNSSPPAGRSNLSIGTQQKERNAHSSDDEVRVSVELIAEQLELVSEPAVESGRSYPADFELFWTECPVKQGKWPAYDKSWRKLKPAERKRAVEGMRLYAARVKREQIERPKWPQGWLTDKRWEDELAQVAEAQPGQAWWERAAEVAEISEQRWRDGIEKFANGIWPVEKLGPPPGHHQCVVPRHLVDELRLEETYTRHGIKRGTAG